ncbi:hypothetical protein CARUB_v10028684mg [Capsella rubella]|uniref:Uncharacterized protein n=1 Tax=Capsella rubella TaxID=81985 RepID=R0EUJ7_9BRAS|nr:hypothetical protein CARUB_v10028684mg [Capsella rubella]
MQDQSSGTIAATASLFFSKAAIFRILILIGSYTLAFIHSYLLSFLALLQFEYICPHLIKHLFSITTIA